MLVKKKISVLYDFLDEVGGLERLMFHQVKFLKDHYVQDIRFFYVDDRKRDDICRSLGLPAGVEVKRIGGRRSKFMSLARAFYSNDLEDQDIDLCICYSFLTALAAYRKKRSEGTPYMVYLNHPPNYLYGRKLVWVNNFLRLSAYMIGLIFARKLKAMDIDAVQNSAAVFVNSKHTAERIEKIYGVSTSIVYPPIDDSFRIVPREWSLAHCKQELPVEFALMHGRIIPDKRPEWAVEAFAMAAEGNESLHLVVSGAEGKTQTLARTAARLGVGDRVLFLGYQTADQLVALYNLASVFLMPAPEEDFGLTPVEAIACGCPVVAWNDGCGPSETVKDGVTGVLAQPYDLKAFASAIDESLARKWNQDDFKSEAIRFSEASFKSNFCRVTNDVFSAMK